jgi:ABC-2 type transport system permease protein
MDAKSPSRPAIVLAILRKDFLQFSRDRLYLILSIAGLILFISAFYLIPSTVEDFAVIGIAHGGLGPLEEALEEESEGGLKILRFPDGDSLRRVMAKEAQAWSDQAGRLLILDRDDRAARPKGGRREKPVIGLDFPPGFLQDIASGNAPAVRIYLNNDTPAELQGAMASMVRELVYMMAGQALPVSEPAEDTVILGLDRSGAQVPLRDRMRPLLVFFVLMVETFALSSLISVEILHRTVVAVSATPARTGDVLIAKIIFGTMLAFVQAFILLLATGTFAAGNPLILLLAAITGALMFAGIAMAVGSMGKDFMGTLAWTMTIIMPFAIPAITALFPGSAPPWVRFVPSWGIIQILNITVNYGAGWAEAVPHFAVALAWVAGLLGLGLWTLSRKVARL